MGSDGAGGGGGHKKGEGPPWGWGQDLGEQRGPSAEPEERGWMQTVRPDNKFKLLGQRDQGGEWGGLEETSEGQSRVHRKPS